MKYLLILILSIISISSCKSRKKAQETAKVEKAEQMEDKQEEKPESNMPTLEKLSPQEMRDYELIQEDFADSLVAQIRRTPCFGRCPTYTLSIYKSGYAVYKGERNVENIGLFTAKVDQDQINQLMNKANEVGFFKMKYFYDEPNVTDVPSTITSIRNETEIKSIVDRFNTPKELIGFNKYFDELFKSVEWKKVEKVSE